MKRRKTEARAKSPARVSSYLQLRIAKTGRTMRAPRRLAQALVALGVASYADDDAATGGYITK